MIININHLLRSNLYMIGWDREEKTIMTHLIINIGCQKGEVIHYMCEETELNISS